MIGDLFFDMERENRKITNIARFIIICLMTGAFSCVWIGFYNKSVFHVHSTLMYGAIIAISAWLLAYLKFARVYRAFKIASNAISEIAFSQFLSISFADLIIYLCGCIAARKYIDIIPGAITVLIQLVIGIVWAMCSKHYFLKHVDPQKCVLIYEEQELNKDQLNIQIFIKKLELKYGHLFDIAEKVEATGDIENYFDIIQQYPVIFIDGITAEKRNKLIAHCVGVNKRFYLIPTLEDAIACGYQVKHFIDTPILSYDGTQKIQTYPGKRVLDIIISLLLLIIISPILLVTAVAIKVEDRGPVLFKQKRVGAGGKVFEILKFRSMVIDAEADGKPKPAVENDPRITKVGNVIRKTRIDELPQLINILKGDISMVGPRPERVEHVELYTKDIPEFTYRLKVPQGLTGYAQIYGKYNTTPQDKLLLDLFYIEQQGLIMDARIFFLTIKTVFTPESTEGFDEDKSEEISSNSRNN